MVFLPTTTLGRLLLGAIIFLYICLLVLNLVSFGGVGWITYVDYNVQFGLWRVCYGAISASRTCSQWSNGQDIVDTATNTIIFSGKPSFVKAAEGLEITSLVFYIIAGILIIIGIIDLERAPLEYMFGAAAILLFLCIIFLSASLGVMSVQGRNNHLGAYLDWAWWNGLAGLIVTIICVIGLIGFIVYMIRTDHSALDYADNFGQIYPYPQQQPWNFFPPVMMTEMTPPSFMYPSYSQWPPGYQAQQFNPNIYSLNQFLPYPGVNEQSPSPLITALVQQQLSRSY